MVKRKPDDDRIVSHDAPRFMNIAVLDVYGFQTCFGSAASAFENTTVLS